MSKTTSTIVLIVLLFLLTSVDNIKANPWPLPGVDIDLVTPQNQTYQKNSQLVTFVAKQYHRQSVAYYYTLDYGERKIIHNISTTLEIKQYPVNPPIYYKEVAGNITLDNLSEGRHTITVYCSSYDRESTYFFIDTPPAVKLQLIENTTSESPSIQLNFTVNQPTQKIQYSLDGMENQTIIENVTLANLSTGLHNLTIYAWDKSGNIGMSEQLYFTVANEEHVESIALPTEYSTVFNITVITAVTSIVIAFTILLFRRHRIQKKARAMFLLTAFLSSPIMLMANRVLQNSYYQKTTKRMIEC